jgi:RNA polymerase sigma factor (sigma-70 family)
MAPDVLDSVVPSSDTQQPQTALDQKERAEVLSRAIGGLSDADRLVLKLRFADDLSGPLVAEILDISHTAARQRIFRALRRLERELADAAGDYFE